MAVINLHLEDYEIFFDSWGGVGRFARFQSDEAVEGL